MVESIILDQATYRLCFNFSCEVTHAEDSSHVPVADAVHLWVGHLCDHIDSGALRDIHNLVMRRAGAVGEGDRLRWSH